MKSVLKEAKERMSKSLDAYEGNIGSVRTGRANPAVLNRVYVSYYGASTPLNQLASITSPDPRTLVVTPFDKSALADIERAILESDLGFNPNNRGDSIFIVVPPLTDERRRDLVKSVRAMSEEAKVAVRNIRRDANERLKNMQREGQLSEDELRQGENEVQKLTDEFIAAVDKRFKSKEEDILAV